MVPMRLKKKIGIKCVYGDQPRQICCNSPFSALSEPTHATYGRDTCHIAETRQRANRSCLGLGFDDGFQRIPSHGAERLLSSFGLSTLRPFYGVFLDLRKAFDAMDRERCLIVLEGYGAGPRMIRLIRGFWGDAIMVCRAAGN
jgi:hypothetical protein